MSADKKKPEGKEAGESLHQDRGLASASAKSDDAAKDMKPDQVGRASRRARARNQDVLPGILGKQLRAAYGELLNAPVPDTFTDLIKRLESKEPGSCQATPGKPRGEESDP